eukprot:Mrub_13088.p1 GENE.Mrub_13088~~Mrub_13088.p1  ORF type:complete len:168 (-),score=26.36 Mrub_13088:25-459(-)
MIQRLDSVYRYSIFDQFVFDTFQDGEIIVKKGSNDKYFYILYEGEALAIYKDEIVKKYYKGMYFGEKSIINNTCRSMDVKSNGPTILLRLEGEKFLEIFNYSYDIITINMNSYIEDDEDKKMKFKKRILKYKRFNSLNSIDFTV